MLYSSVLFHFVILWLVHHNHGIESLSRYIAPIDNLNEVINQIFSSLQFETHRESKIKEYSKMHKYFVSLARLHKNDWIDLLKITSLDIKLDNATGDYTTIINEVLNEENKTEAVNDMLNEENVNKHIEDFLGTLESVKELYLRNNSFINVNYEILHRFHRNRDSLRNKTVDRLHFAQNDSDFWVPDSRRVYQGKRIKIKQFPFMASVHMFDQFTCAGSIIHGDLVITAASCLQLAHNNRFYRENPSFLSVRIGSSTYSGGDRVPVLEVYFYPSYEPKTLKNNLAILRLERVIKFNKKNKNVKKIRIDTNARALPPNTDGITIVGWGARTKSNKIYNPWKNKLAMAVLHFYGLADCRHVYSKDLVTKKNFCAGFFSRGGGACNRDVGAPGVVNGILAGVVSFGSPNCGERGSPTVFTKLGYYIDWIEDIMAQDPPKQSIRITTRRPHLFHTIMSTRPSHESNFLIEPIDLSKVPDIRDLDVRMPQEDKNEFLNGEVNSMQPVSIQTFPTSKQIIKQDPKEPKTFVDITRLRDVNENKGSLETTYEPPQLNPIYTVMGNFEEDEKLPMSNDRFVKTSTIADLLAQTRVPNKEIKDAKPNVQIGLETAEKSESVEDTTEISDDTRESITTHNFDSTTTTLNVIDKSNDRFVKSSTIADLLAQTRAQNKEIKDAKTNEQIGFEHAEKSESVEDTTEILDDTRESITTHNFESTTTPLNVIDKRLEANHTDAETLLSSDDYDGDSETVVVQQSLPIHPILKEKVLSIKTPEKAIVNEKKRGVSQKIKQPVLDKPDLDKEIEIFIENLDFEALLHSEDELETQVLTDTEFPEQHINQKVNHKRYSLQDQNTKPGLKNGDMFPLRDLTPKDDNVFPLQDQKTKPAQTNGYMYPQQDQEVELSPKNDHMFPLQGQKTKSPSKKYNLNPQQYQNTKPAPKKYHTVSLQDENTESAPTNDYMYPQQEQETEPAPTNDYKFPLQDQKTKPPPKQYYLNSKQGQKRKPALEKYNMVPLQDEETMSALKYDYMFPLQDRQTKPPPKKYYTVPVQDEETKSAQKKYDTFPLRDPAAKNDDIFPLQVQKIQPAQTNYYVYPQKYQKTKPPPKSYYTIPLQDEETESAPTNDYMYPQQDQEAEPAPLNDHKFPLQDQKIKPPPKKYYLNPQQDQKKKAEPNNYKSFHGEEEELAPINDYMYPQQNQEAEPALTNDHKFPLHYQKIKPPPNFFYLNQQQDQKKKAPPKNDFTYPIQHEAEPAPTSDYMYAQQDEETELAPRNDHKFPLKDQETRQPPKKYYTIPLQYEEIEPAQTNDDGFLPQTQKAESAPTHNFLPPLQDQKGNPAQINSNVPPLQKQESKPALKGEDILTFLYLSDNERKTDDSSPEGLSIERKKVSHVLEVIAEELRKEEE